MWRRPATRVEIAGKDNLDRYSFPCTRIRDTRIFIEGGRSTHTEFAAEDQRVITARIADRWMILAGYRLADLLARVVHNLSEVENN